MEDRLNWLIFGAGAIGTYIGVHLILHGQNVVFLEKPEEASYLREHGLRFSIQGQDHRLLHPDIYPSLPEVLNLGNFDVAIFALKSYDTQTVLDGIRPFRSRLPPILCLQNGVENEKVLEQGLGKDKVIAGTVTSAVLRRGIGDIVLERQRGIGIADGHVLSKPITTSLSGAGLNAHLYSSSASLKWSKMLTNLLANASCAILDMTPGEILTHPGLYQIEVAQIREALSVMTARKIRPIDLPGVPVTAFAFVVKSLPPALSRWFISRIAGKGRGQKMPSFHIDLHSGCRKSEVDYLNGAVVRAGKRLQVATPVNLWLNQTLLQMVQGDLPADAFSHQPEKYIHSLYSYSVEK